MIFQFVKSTEVNDVDCQNKYEISVTADVLKLDKPDIFVNEEQYENAPLILVTLLAVPVVNVILVRFSQYLNISYILVRFVVSISDTDINALVLLVAPALSPNLIAEGYLLFLLEMVLVTKFPFVESE